MAGAAYLPIDPALPEARRAYLAETADVTLVLTQARLADLGWPDGLPAVAGDGLAPTDADGRPAAGAHPSHPAYVLFTSPSTGHPTGAPLGPRPPPHPPPAIPKPP